MTDEVKTPEEILELWAELRLSLEEVEKDLNKNLIKGNTAAGRRVRSTLRKFKTEASQIMRDMIALEKNRKEG